MERTITCICCPLGCQITVGMSGGEIIDISEIPASGRKLCPQRNHGSGAHCHLYGQSNRRHCASGIS